MLDKPLRLLMNLSRLTIVGAVAAKSQNAIRNAVASPLETGSVRSIVVYPTEESALRAVSPAAMDETPPVCAFRHGSGNSRPPIGMCFRKA